MLRSLRSGLLVLLLLSGCGWNGTPTRINDITPLSSIEIVPAVSTIATSKTIAVNTSTKLTVIGNYSGLFTKDITDQANWTSSTPAVAEFSTVVNNRNRIGGVSAGTSIIGASVGNIAAPPFMLTVSPATVDTITVTAVAPDTTTIATGLTSRLLAEGTFSDQSIQDLTYDADWSSNATAIATVDTTADTRGLVRGVATGSATITAAFGGKNGTAAIAVTDPILLSLAVTPANPTLLSVSTASFKAIGTYSDGTTKDLTGQSTWESSLPGIASIVPTSGVATSIVPGTAVIKATSGGFTGSTNLKVTGGTLSSISLAIDKFVPQGGIVTMVKDTSGRVVVTGTFNNGSTRDITAAAGISVTDTSAGITSPGGNLKWVNAATVTTAPVTLSANFSQLPAVTAGTMKVAIIAPTIVSLEVSPSSITDLVLAASRRVVALGTYNDGTIQDITANVSWASAAPLTASVGTVDLAKGKVIGVAEGTTTITATYGALSKSVNPTTVVARTVSRIDITPGSTSLTSGTQKPFTATVTFSDNSTADVTESAVWSLGTTSTHVAVFADTVNQPGQVVAVDSGTATLTASFGTKQASVTITVP